MRARHLLPALGLVAGGLGCRLIMGADPLTYEPEDGGTPPVEAGDERGPVGPVGSEGGGDERGMVADGQTGSSDAGGSDAGAVATHEVAIGSWPGAVAACVIHHGALECWGSNADQALGLANDGGTVLAPTIVPGADDGGTFAATSVGLEQWHGCALRGGLPFCWGLAMWGRLGNKGDGTHPLPVDFAQPVSVVADLAVGGSFTCARTPAADVFCWGDHAAGAAYDQLTSDFDKTRDTMSWNGAYSQVAIPLPSLAGAKSVALGRDHGCVVRAGGDVACWGRNDFFQAGQPTSDGCVPYGTDAGANACVKTPAVVSGPSDVVELALGERHSCALDARGKVWCWGANDQGQLGDAAAGANACLATPGGQGSPLRCTATPVAAFDGAQRIAVGGAASCALKAGNVYCWGDDSDGLLGGPGASSAVPLQVRTANGPLANVRDLAVGATLACAITNDDALFCWGRDFATNATVTGAQPVAW